ncbi:hypothetical protein Tco_1104949 [Tanacetum coccineum]
MNTISRWNNARESCWNWNVGGPNIVGNMNPGPSLNPLCLNKLQRNRARARKVHKPKRSSGVQTTFKDKMQLNEGIQRMVLYWMKSRIRLPPTQEKKPPHVHVYGQIFHPEDPIYDEAGHQNDLEYSVEAQDQDTFVDHMESIIHLWKTTEEHVYKVNVSSVRNDSLMSISSMNALNMVSKELAGVYEQRAKVELTDRERKIDEQMRIIISDQNRKETSLKSELHSAQLQLRSTLNHHKIISNLENQIQEKDKVIRDLKVLVSNVNDRSCEPYNANDVTALIEQNECVRVELEEIEDLKAQLEGNLKVAARSSVKTKVLAPGLAPQCLKMFDHISSILGLHCQKTYKQISPNLVSQMSQRRLLASLQAPFLKEKKGVRFSALYLEQKRMIILINKLKMYTPADSTTSAYPYTVKHQLVKRDPHQTFTKRRVHSNLVDEDEVQAPEPHMDDYEYNL